MPNLRELERAKKALDAGDIVLAKRYLDNALAQVRCMICHEGLTEGRPYQPYFKTWVHDTCLDAYGSRSAYLLAHGEKVLEG